MNFKNKKIITNFEQDLLVFDITADFQPADMLRISSSLQIFINYGDYEPRQKS